MIDKTSMQQIRNAFQSILRSDYISIAEIEQLKELDGYYVDFFNNLPKILQNQDSYINGRRGTGKTALLMRAYYECLKTISPSVRETSYIIPDKKILPIYIDLSQCGDIFEDGDSDSLERSFIFKLVDELQSQLSIIFEESKFKMLKRDFSNLEAFDDLIHLIQDGMLIKSTQSNLQKEINTDYSDQIKAGISIQSASVEAEQVNSVSIKDSYSIEEIRNCNVQNFLELLGQIRKKSKLDAIYVFIDEFSDLTEKQQNEFSILLKKLLGSKNNVFFKVGTITDRFYFGEQIIIGRDIFPITLDLSDFVERYGGIVAASKELVIFTENLIKMRLSIFAPKVSIDQLFKNDKNEIVVRISKEAMGVPRTIGLILQNALTQAEIKEYDFIQLSDINVGLREARKIYFKQFQGAVQKKVIPGFYMDMWNSLLEKALNEKNKNQKKPASHFMVDPIRKKYLNIFCENFIIHCLEDSRASKYGGNYVLYSLDFDICNDNNISYADEKDEFTAVRFIYDSVLQQFDCYFMKDKLKSYKCPLCNVVYDESEVVKMKVKRCFECDEKLIEIIHKDAPITSGNYTEVEVKILGIIATLNREEAMSAVEIGDAVGCSYQKVANWCSKVLNRKELIEVEKRDGKNYYYDKAE